MTKPDPLTGQCPHCGATADKLAYHSRYTLKSGQTVRVIRCKQHKGTFCDRYGTAFYNLKTPEEKVQRAINQELEGLCPEAVARIEQVHPTTVQRWVDRAVEQARAADKQTITGVSTDNVELDELHSFAGAKHPDGREVDLDQVGQHWVHCAMARESRLLLEVVVGPRNEESAMDLVEGAAKRLRGGCWPLWSSDGPRPLPVRVDGRFRRPDSFHSEQTPRATERVRNCARSKTPIWTSRQRAERPPSCGGDPTRNFRGRRVDPAQANFDLALGTIERDDPPTRRSVTSQDPKFREVSDIA